MGSLRDIINSADNSTQMDATVKESLKLLMELAESKAVVFEQDLANSLLSGQTIDTLQVPVSKVINKRVEYRALTQESSSHVLDQVTSTITEIIDNPNALSITQGIAGIAYEALDTIMGVGEGQEQVVKCYSVAALNPAIVRFDFSFWLQKIASEAIKKYVESALVCVVYESAVDVSKLSLNDFLVIYGPVLHKAFPNQDDAPKIMEMTEEAIKLYKTLLGEKPDEEPGDKPGDKPEEKPSGSVDALFAQSDMIGAQEGRAALDDKTVQDDKAAQDMADGIDLSSAMDLVLANKTPHMVVG